MWNLKSGDTCQSPCIFNVAVAMLSSKVFVILVLGTVFKAMLKFSTTNKTYIFTGMYIYTRCVRKVTRLVL